MEAQQQFLIIAEDETFIPLIKSHLEGAGVSAQFRGAADMQQIDAALASHGWDLVLLDYGIQSSSFQAHFQLLRERARNVPVVLLVDEVSTEQAVDLIKQGIADIVRKDGLARLAPAIERSLHEASINRGKRTVEVSAWRQSERVLKLLESITDSFIVLDREWRITFVNPQTLQLLHVREEDLLGTTVWDAFPGSAGSIYEEGYNRALRDNTPVEFEAYYEPMQVWTAVRAHPFEDGLAIYAHDITARKQAEEAARVAQERLATAVKAANVGLWDWDLHANKIHFSPEWKRQLGHADDEIGDTMEAWESRLHPDDSLSARTRVADFLTRPEGEYQNEFRMRHKDGGYRWILSQAALLRDAQGDPYRMLGAHIDITELKLAELERKADEDRYRRGRDALIALTRFDVLKPDDLGLALRKITERSAKALDVARVSVWRYNADRSAIDCVDLYELAEDRHSSSLSLSKSMCPDYFQAMAECELIDAPHAQEDPRTREFTRDYLKPLGITSMMDTPIYFMNAVDGVVCCEHIGPPRQWTDDEKTFAVAAANLASLAIERWERKRVEQARAELEEQLRQSQKLEAVGLLAGGVAHDFNNVLGVILGYAELVQNREGLAPAVGEEMGRIITAAQHAAELTNQLLGFARKQAIAPKPLDLHRAVESLLKMLRRLIGEQIALQWKPGAQRLSVYMDESQIGQILSNLVVNARDAISGNGEIVLEAAQVKLDESDCANRLGCAPGNYVQLTVRDTGHGMEPEQLSHIFEPFYTTKEIGKGSGLGLATVYGIVKQNKGFIEVQSEKEVGTTFSIYFPALDATETPAELKAASLPLAKGTETVLLVEDEPALLELGTTLLKRMGYTVLPANEPETAVQVAEEYPQEIHLLMTDVIMPGLSGREVSERVRALRPEIRCLFMSGYTADIIAEHGILDDGVNFLQKPFTLRNLTEKLREALAKS